MLKACLLGFGGIAQLHWRAYERLEKRGICQLVGVFDIRPEQVTKKTTINIDVGDVPEMNFHYYNDVDEMLSKEKPDIVDICVPTYLHEEKTIEMLRRGYHVQCEKPMSLTYEQCARMLEASKESGKKLMIGQILHFSPAFMFLKQVVDDGRYGRVKSAFFQRLSSPPKWSYANWFLNYERSGGALVDFHVHDVDMVKYLFGKPKTVVCRLEDSVNHCDACFSSFYYDDKTVLAVADWSLENHPFSAIYRVCFEKAVVEMTADEKVVVFPACGGEPQYPELAAKDEMEAEIEYFSSVVSGETENIMNPPESAAETIRLIEALRESAAQGGALIQYR